MVPKYTFVAVTYEDDYPAIALQACTMGMFLPPEFVERIMITNNSSKENLFNIDTVLPHYRSLDVYVTVIRRRDSRLARTAATEARSGQESTGTLR